MSLDKAAKHLAAHGRGSDTELIHMSKREIKGLQQLAKANGGSLTINPHTGLLEAGFLEQALPIVAAAAATYLTAGAASALLPTALAGTTAGGILAGAGAGALIGSGSAALQGKDAGQGALYGGIGGAIAGGAGAFDAAPNVFAGGTGAAATQQAATQVGTQAATSGVDAAGNAITMANPSGPGFINPEIGPTGATMTNSLYPNATQAGTNVAQMAPGAARNAALDQLASQQGVFAEGAAQLPGQGLTAVADQTWWDKLPTSGKVLVGGTGLAAAGSLLGDTGQNQPSEEEYDPNDPYRMRLSKNFQGATPVKPNPYYQANYTRYAAGGGLMDAGYAPGGPVEAMSMRNQNQFYPQGQQDNTQFSTSSQMPTSAEVVNAGYEPATQPYSGAPVPRFNAGGDPKKKKKASLTTAAKLAAMDPHEAAVAGLGNAMYHSQMPSDVAKGLQPTMNMGDLNLAEGGHLGGYSDGGRLLKGPGDGVSDSIPAQIGKRQPARLADGEFVIPARIVSELGNGSTDAGARKLYEMMDKVQASRKKSIGKGKFAVNSKAAKHLPK